MAIDRIAWDSCTWIALIQQERIRDDAGKITEDRYVMCREVILAAEAGRCEIIFSALCYAEVCKNKDLMDKDKDKIAAFFENDYFLPVSLDGANVDDERPCQSKAARRLPPRDCAYCQCKRIADL